MFGCIAGLAILSLVKSVAQVPDMSIAQKYANAPWLFWGGSISLVIWMILKIWGDKKRETVSAGDEGVAAAEALESISQNALAELQVPSAAVAVDILTFYYKRKDGEIKLAEKPMQLFSHMNIPYLAFADAENLYFADASGKYAFPRTFLKGIQTVKKKARLSQWNKADAFQSETYKAYRMTTDQFGSVHTKPYYILEIQKNEETWGLYFPCYELPQIEALTGLRAE